jgi:hypothetical protein
LALFTSGETRWQSILPASNDRRAGQVITIDPNWSMKRLKRLKDWPLFSVSAQWCIQAKSHGGYGAAGVAHARKTLKLGTFLQVSGL